ncbi:MAG: hypothetical protein R3B99_18875 [Polyangiales bacterium]|nr:hypothetical protein [Myxococcales bacterium]MCB9599245.1 hypothetical protein [Sandaracinus sp.]
MLFGVTFAVAYLWTVGGAVHGREVFIARAPSAVGAGVLLGVLALGVVLALATARSELPGLEGHARLQRIALVLASAFAVAHAALAWWPLASGQDPVLAYHQLRSTLPYALPAVASCLGLAFVALHLELSLHAFVDAFDLVRRPASRRWLRVGHALLAAGFFALAVNGLAVFVTGTPFVGGEEAPARLFPLEEGSP